MAGRPLSRSDPFSSGAQEGGAARAVYVYILPLNNGRFYVGITRDVTQRFEAHEQEPGPFVARFGVDRSRDRSLVRCSEETALYQECVKTAQLIWEKGINNVRGAFLSQRADYERQDVDKVAAFVAFYTRRDRALVRDHLLRQLALEDGNYHVYSMSLDGGRQVIGVVNHRDAMTMQRQHETCPSPFVRRFRRRGLHVRYDAQNLGQAAARALADRITADRMYGLGVQNVRGGMYTNVDEFVEADLAELAAFIAHQRGERVVDVRRHIGESFGRHADDSPPQPPPSGSPSNSFSHAAMRGVNASRASAAGSSGRPAVRTSLHPPISPMSDTRQVQVIHPVRRDLHTPSAPYAYPAQTGGQARPAVDASAQPPSANPHARRPRPSSPSNDMDVLSNESSQGSSSSPTKRTRQE